MLWSETTGQNNDPIAAQRFFIEIVKGDQKLDAMYRMYGRGWKEMLAEDEGVRLSNNGVERIETLEPIGK